MELYIIIAIIFSFAASWIISLLLHKANSKPSGCIHVDETNPDKDVYTFEFYVPPYQINERKKVIFEIRKKNTYDYRKEV